MIARRYTAAGAAALGVAAFASLTGTASASPTHVTPQHVIKTLSSSFVGPLQFAVDRSHVYVADSFTSTLTRIDKKAPIATNPGQDSDLAGVAVDHSSGAIAYTKSNGDHSATSLTILAKGHAPVVADLAGYEKTKNPDKIVDYGIDNPTQCQIDGLAAIGAPASYAGEVDSHPYAVVSLGHGAWAVADAGGNDILKVDKSGHVSTISVLPAQPVVLSAAFAAANGLPSCLVNATYKFESVPTDVEVGPNGKLYATTLPGGPEGPDSGNPGSVYKISASGAATRIATGFNSATNLAIDGKGKIYVAELGSATISELYGNGQHAVVLSLPGVVAVEFAQGHLYASTAPAVTGADGPGTVVLLGS